MKKRYIWGILTVAWCIIIFVQSHKPAVNSTVESSYVTERLNDIISFLANTDKIRLTDNVVRKTAHFLEFYLLGFLSFKTFVSRGREKGAFWISTLFSVLFAVSDELHQYFIPGRAMRLFDVFIDSLGITAATLLQYFNSVKGSR